MHDHKGRELQVGDKVLIPFVVTEVYSDIDYCNVTLKSVHGRKPDGAKEVLTGNSAVTFRNNEGDDNGNLVNYTPDEDQPPVAHTKEVVVNFLTAVVDKVASDAAEGKPAEPANQD